MIRGKNISCFVGHLRGEEQHLQLAHISKRVAHEPRDDCSLTKIGVVIADIIDNEKEIEFSAFRDRMNESEKYFRKLVKEMF